MPDFLLLMHDDLTSPEETAAWGPYLAELRKAGVFEGGSSIGKGDSVRKSGAVAPPAAIVGFVRITAPSLEAAKALVAGNPVYEAGGTVEIRLLDEG
ncbi:MAG TPA: hypothetical protein DCL54_18605 [Alphaproteobacteria bacterium]|nr:hypothetical protein [Alphaproteobacteria bacterium]HAJ48594.1 hypothetical protein [Alphaproteobacteria bacterium]